MQRSVTCNVTTCFSGPRAARRVLGRNDKRIATAAILSAAMAMTGCRKSETMAVDDRSDVLNIAYDFKDGGGYSLSGTGCPLDVTYSKVQVLQKSKGPTHCCGYTFAVGWRAAEQRGLLKGKSIDQIWRFQKVWFGAVKEAAEEGPVLAIEELGIGRRITPAEAQAGDFVQIQRPKSRTAHQAIFLGWVKEGSHIIGLKYRSSQGQSHGIGDYTEYFSGSGVLGASADPKRFYVARLD